MEEVLYLLILLSILERVLDLIKLLFTNELFLLLFTIILTGILAAETRIALEILHLHQKFNLNILDNESKKWVLKNQYRSKRYLIGITTSFVAIISLAKSLDFLNQSVIGLIAALSGNSFLTKQIDGSLDSALDKHLKEKATNDLLELEEEYIKLIDQIKDSGKSEDKITTHDKKSGNEYSNEENKQDNPA